MVLHKIGVVGGKHAGMVNDDCFLVGWGIRMDQGTTGMCWGIRLRRGNRFGASILDTTGRIGYEWRWSRGRRRRRFPIARLAGKLRASGEWCK